MTLDSYTSLTDAANLIAAAGDLGATIPKRLTNLIAAHKVIATAPPTTDPVTAILDAAESGSLTEAKVAKLVADAASTTAVAEYRATLAQRAGRQFLGRFYDCLGDGDADTIIDSLRPAFDNAASAIDDALRIVDINTSDTELATTATAEQLTAWRGLASHLNILDRIAAIATTFAPDGTFGIVDNPRERDVVLKGNSGPLHPRAVMCSQLPLDQGWHVFMQPHRIGDVRTSPWIAAQPVLHTLDEARERVRAWAEDTWAVADATRGKTYSSVNGQLVEDTRRNPFSLAEQPA
ncbi:hypothetical protein [Mycolicibacterium phocaicum]|uniref:Uncharacterized protein n=1 Tax=Mycolicibacterium phocaicum TaxID=319706 RepID=A0A7I7ZTM8_9MYCO|nr:hypothetical protein [Mycolicibacterium phocaicum]TLH61005.1 hypothetical protein C1S79_25790 [Mycolicibacterium phocaicum]BBZ57069.1 hypothetical protein MPHO_40610 [Mycolicibacterium phocaicum]